MARGQQKIQAQQKNAAKKSASKKSTDHKAAAMKALVFTCPVCRSQMPDPKTYKQHFESKHPRSPLPPELAESAWSIPFNDLITFYESHKYSLQLYI